MADVSPPSFENIYAAYAPFVRRVLKYRGVSQSDLDDVTQETFVTLHRLLPQFEGRSSLETWLNSIAWRVAANYRRRVRVRARGSLPMATDAESEEALSAERYRASLHLLDDDKRDLFLLHEIGGWSISSLSELTGRARATIRTRIDSARVALARTILGGTPTPKRIAWLEGVAARFEERSVDPQSTSLRVLPDGMTCISTIDSLVLAVWRGPATDEALHALLEVLFAQARAWPSGIRYFSLVESTSSPPTQEGRAMMAWAARKLGKKVLAYANTVEGTLLPHVAALVNASLWLARAPFEVRYFYELMPALTWLEQFGPLDAARTLAQLERMRGALAPAPAAWKLLGRLG